jgi:transcriptional regulator with GAF, ATPase, and Fis domain
MELSKDAMAKLIELNTKIVRKESFENKITIIADTVKDIIQADRCSIFVHDKKSQSFWTIHADGISYIEIPDSKGIISKVFQTKEIVIENNLLQNTNAIKSVDGDYIVESMLSVPIFGFDNECIGVVQVLNKFSEDGFDELDIKTLKFVVNHFTTFIQLIVQEN